MPQLRFWCCCLLFKPTMVLVLSTSTESHKLASQLLRLRLMMERLDEVRGCGSWCSANTVAVAGGVLHRSPQWYWKH